MSIRRGAPIYQAVAPKLAQYGVELVLVSTTSSEEETRAFGDELDIHTQPKDRFCGMALISELLIPKIYDSVWALFFKILPDMI